MTLDKSIVQKHFDLHAKQYDSYAKVQFRMANTLAAKVKKELDQNELSYLPLSICEIGCGTGYLTRLLLDLFPNAQLTVLDLSARMLMTLQNKLAKDLSRIQIIHADAEMHEFLPPRKFDLIISNATFQWLNHPHRTISKYLKYLHPHRYFAFATFASQTFSELHTSFALAQQQLHLPPYRHGQLFMSESEWKAIFSQNGGEELSWTQELYLEYYPSVRQFLHAVQQMGAAHASSEENQKQTVPLTKKLLRLMEEVYQKQFTELEGIRVTYDCGYGMYVNQNMK